MNIDIQTSAADLQPGVANELVRLYTPQRKLNLLCSKSSPNKSIVKNSDCEAMSKVKLEWILSLGFSTNLDILVDVQTERKTDKQKERRTNRKKDRQTEGKTDKQKERRTNRKKDGQTEGKTYKQKERRTNRRKDGHTKIKVMSDRSTEKTDKSREISIQGQGALLLVQ